MPEKTRNWKKSEMQKDWAIFLNTPPTGTPQQNVYDESISNNYEASMSNDEFCRIYDREV